MVLNHLGWDSLAGSKRQIEIADQLKARVQNQPLAHIIFKKLGIILKLGKGTPEIREGVTKWPVQEMDPLLVRFTVVR